MRVIVGAVDLARTSVFFDFDGTITPVDVGVHLLDRLAGPSWQEIEERYDAGEIGSRECIVLQWEMLPRDEALLREVAREIEVDPAFGPLVDALRAAGAEVMVVSDGFGFHVVDAIAPYGVPVLTNAVDFASWEMAFPNADRCCPCSTCGTCKQAPLKDARRAGRSVVFVGDGTSDRKAGLLADVLFARGSLADWCDLTGVEYRPFASLADVHRSLLG
jgi:2-hydroxy-3-keto-5-methylthiopentenyl-1-phosphate phosphatase